MKNKKIKLLIMIVVGLIVGAISAYILPTKQIIIKKSLPPKIVFEKTLQQLNANIKGEIVDKSADSFTLKTISGLVTIFYDPQGLSSFMRAGTNQELTFDDLKIGDKVDGGVSIIISDENIIGKLGNRKIGDVIAHNFNIQ